MPRSTLYTLISVIITSSISLVCLVTFGWDELKLKRQIPLMIALTIGVLAGEAVFHLIPESLKQGTPLRIAVGLCCLGLAFSYGFEIACGVFLGGDGPAPVARISLFAESLHNAVDGAIIAAAYITGIRVGLFATLAIVLHEVPHELGNFSVLVHGGYGRGRALLLNGLSACAAIVGALAVIFAGRALSAYATAILPFAAGCFIYISLFDLLPDLWKGAERHQRKLVGYGVAAGAGFMFVLTLST